MKSYRQLISEVAQPKSGDEINFKAKHEIEMIDHPESEESQHSSDAKKAKRMADYDDGDDEAVYEALDPVGKEDDDVDNDGDVDDSDRYLKNRRSVIKKAISKQDAADLDEATMAQRKALKMLMTKALDGKRPTKDMTSAIGHNGDFVVYGGSGRIVGRLEAGTYSNPMDESAHIDEISKKTMASYVKKAASDSTKTAYDLGAGKDDASFRKLRNRSAGIHKAASRLAKEDVNLDESKMQTRTFINRAENLGKSLIKLSSDIKGLKNVAEQDRIDISNEIDSISGDVKALAKTATSLPISESVALSENFTVGTTTLDDGTTVKLKKQEAEMLNALFDGLNASNRKNMMKSAMANRDGMKDVLSFAKEAM